MGTNTKIQWTHHTFQPWIGCEKVSEGCKFCYAECSTPARVSAHRGLPLWGANAHRHITGESNWRLPLKWNREAARDGVRRRVFCASLADIFEEYRGPDAAAVALAQSRLFALTEKTPNLLWLLLTKRPENVLPFVPDNWIADKWPSNVWLGFTAENQQRFDERWEHAKRIPAPVIFTSIEPQIGPVVLPADYLARGQRVWPFIGGESGPSARTFDLVWARNIINQCLPAGVPAFMKQAGSRPYSSDKARDYPGRKVWMWGAKDTLEQKLLLDFADKKGGDPEEWPEDLRVRQIPEFAALPSSEAQEEQPKRRAVRT